MTKRQVFVSQCLVGLVLAIQGVGCNKEKLPGLGQVVGTISLDGKPVADASVAFVPAETGATTSMGQTDATGKYELYYSRGNKGAKVGEHTVTVNKFRDS